MTDIALRICAGITLFLIIYSNYHARKEHPNKEPLEVHFAATLAALVLSAVVIFVIAIVGTLAAITVFGPF